MPAATFDDFCDELGPRDSRVCFLPEIGLSGALRFAGFPKKRTVDVFESFLRYDFRMSGFREITAHMA